MKYLILAIIICGFTFSEVIAQSLEVWGENSTVKIRENQEGNGSKSVNLQAARGEFAAFQIGLRAETDIPGITASITPLKGRGTQIPASRVTLWRQHYVKTPTGNMPDPLSPFKSVDLKAGITQPIYVEIEVPHNANAVSYIGTISFNAGEKEIGKIKVTLKVLDFSLPVKSSLITAFGLWYDLIPQQEGLVPNSNNHERYKQAYYRMLLDHRISSYDLPLNPLEPQAAKYLDDPRLTSYKIPWLSDDAKQKEAVEYLKKGGWLEKGFFYVVDEPVNEEHYNELKKVCGRIKAIDPKLRIVSPYYRNPDWTEDKTVYDLMAGYINIWCFNTGFYHPEELEKRRKAGDEIWSYVCCGPGRPYANLFVDQEAIDHRILIWQQWQHNVEGLLYWSANYWIATDDGTKDPWEDMYTVKWIDKNLTGDGSILYPGKKVGHYGPLPSLRLKLLRQGLQDYEYIKLVSDKRGRKSADNAVNLISSSWTHFTKDPSALENAKAHLAELIIR